MTSSSPNLAVALVGCGNIGANHARALARHPGTTLSAVVDPSPGAADGLADLVENELAQPRPAAFTALDQALGTQPADMVVICTPSGLHVPLAEEALAAGAHVVIEKPLDVSLSRARRIAGLAREAAERGLLTSVISQHRFEPASLAVAHAAGSGAFGTLTSGVASVPWWRDQEYYDSAQWRGTWALDGGGALMNQGVHTVDLLLWFLGEPLEITAHAATLAHERIEVEDVAAATIRFSSGAVAVLHATTAAYPGLGVRIQVHGSQGSAIIEDDRLRYFHAAHWEGREIRPDAGNQAEHVVPPDQLTGATRPPDEFIVGHLRQYEDIVAAIHAGKAAAVTVDDAFRALATVRGIYAAASLGKPVAFADVLAGAYDDLTPTIGGAR